MRISRAQVLSLVRSEVEASKPVSAATDDGLTLSAVQRTQLVRWVRATTTPQRVVTRSVVVLLAGRGWGDARIASELGVTRRTVALWRTRFARGGSGALLVDAPGRGRKPGRDREAVARIEAMSRQRPPEGSRWTVRSLARAVGVSHATVQRVWREHRLQPDSQGAYSLVE